LSSLSTALTLIYVEQLHHNRVALYKTTTKSCKNHLQRSTDPRALAQKNSDPERSLFLFPLTRDGINALAFVWNVSGDYPTAYLPVFSAY
ncbi:MAG: hypothetical protein LPH20_13200, partial [Shewanella sp.]|nr:hypothetical protein [Shewanella sp.]